MDNHDEILDLGDLLEDLELQAIKEPHTFLTGGCELFQQEYLAKEAFNDLGSFIQKLFS